MAYGGRPPWSRSPRSSPSRGKPGTWRRRAGVNRRNTHRQEGGGVLPAAYRPSENGGTLPRLLRKPHKVKQGIDVLICHPRLVQTGLDLIDFPTIVWDETDT